MADGLLLDLFTLRASCLLIALGRAARRLVDHRLDELGMRVNHYSVLKTLSAASPPSQQELAELLRIDVATMVALVDDLSELGYVRRRQDPSDRRRHLLGATPEGRSALRKAERILGECDADLVADIPSAMRDDVRDALAAAARGPHLPERIAAIPRRRTTKVARPA
jgi:DNA-binding MarR family transcriptional regulator